MAYYGPNGNYTGSSNNGGRGGARGWYNYGGMGGGGGRYMYRRGAVPGAAGIVGAAGTTAGTAAWSQAVAAAVQAGNQWGVEVQPNWVVAVIRRDTLVAAEAAAEEVLVRLHPTKAAEKRRHEIIGYAKKLIGTHFGCEVFAFGSVPLKTYLPDGDIDMTVQTNTLLDDTFIDQVCRLLTSEQHNADCPFRLHSIRFIDAKVQLIKCAIDNITVDISFNQFGGVSTLCFLELVDSEVGKGHLFKRSIMLIKAWCFNECNILGAHHWLLSTYALEILVLHIFNVFYRSLSGPLEALYKFLEYYRNFDWENYGLSLDGPVPLSYLRSCAAAEANAANDELLLSMEPLKGSFYRLLQLPADADKVDATFHVKHLNIIDPLKSSNNLGRSVGEESYHRIRSAFAYGAEKLGQLLLHSPGSVTGEVYRLFEKTLKSYGTGQRQDLVTGPLLQLLPETKPNVDVSWSSDTSTMNVDESSTRDGALELTDKEAKVAPAENGSSSSSSSNQCHAESAQEEQGSASNSNGTDANQGKLLLPFAPSELLNLTGDLGQHLGCLRHVQYNLEALFDQLHNSVQEASDAGLLNEEMFRMTTLSALSEKSSTDAGVPNMTAGRAEGHQNPRFDMAGRLPKPHGTGSYFPLPSGLSGDYVPRWQRHRQPSPVQSGTAGESSSSQTPTRQQAPRAAHSRQRGSTGGRIWKALNSQPSRAEDGSGGASSSQPPTLAVPDHGDNNTEEIGLAMAATSIRGESSSPASVSGTVAGESSSSAVTDAGESSRPSVSVGGSSKPAAVAGGECSRLAARGIEGGKLEFGSLGPLSKFIQDFPPLPSTKGPTASVLKISWPAAEASGSAQQSTRPGPSTAHTGKTAESATPTVRSPKHGAAAAQTRPQAYRLKDEADFPPLQGGTR